MEYERELLLCYFPAAEVIVRDEEHLTVMHQLVVDINNVDVIEQPEVQISSVYENTDEIFR